MYTGHERVEEMEPKTGASSWGFLDTSVTPFIALWKTWGHKKSWYCYNTDYKVVTIVTRNMKIEDMSPLNFLSASIPS